MLKLYCKRALAKDAWAIFHHFVILDKHFAKNRLYLTWRYYLGFNFYINKYPLFFDQNRSSLPDLKI